MTTTLIEKEAELKDQFNKEQQAAVAEEEEIKLHQAKHQEHIVNMTRLQGAFSLIQDLKKAEKEPKAD